MVEATAPIPEPSAAPPGEAPAVVETAPAVETAAPPAEAPSPIAEPEAAPESAPAAPEAPAEREAEAPAEEGDKPAEVAAEEAAPEAPAEAEPEAKSFPTYEDWKLPEGMSLQAEQTGALNNILGKYGLSQEAGQEIIDYGSGILRQAQERMDERQREVYAETRQTWRGDFEKMAGNRRDTILEDAKSAVKSALPDNKQRAEFWDVLAMTGAGDHPAVIRAFANIGKRQRERGAPPPGLPADPKRGMSAADRRYGDTKN